MLTLLGLMLDGTVTCSQMLFSLQDVYFLTVFYVKNYQRRYKFFPAL